MARREQRLGGGWELPAPGVEERSDEAPGAGAAPAGAVPDPEVVARPTRRSGWGGRVWCRGGTFACCCWGTSRVWTRSARSPGGLRIL